MSQLLSLLSICFQYFYQPILGGLCYYIIIAPEVSNTLGGYALHVLIFPQIIECEVLTSSTIGIKFIADTFRCRAPDTKLSPQFTTLLAQ
jgi:hypothetical protein